MSSQLTRFTLPKPLLILLSSLPLLLLTSGACGSQDDAALDTAADDSATMREEHTVPTRPPLQSDSKQDSPNTTLQDLNRYPMYETIRFVKQYRDCIDRTCITMLEFGLRGGVLTRYQNGDRVSRHRLSDPDYDSLTSFIQEGRPFLDEFLSPRGFHCNYVDPRRIVYNVTLELRVQTDPVTATHHVRDVSECYASFATEAPDPFIELVKRLDIAYPIGS